jgi:hypothetical protein
MYLRRILCTLLLISKIVSIFRAIPFNGPWNGFAPIKGGGRAVQSKYKCTGGGGGVRRYEVNTLRTATPPD